MATVVNAASRLLPCSAAPALSFETLEHKRRLYRPLMLRACDLLPQMDAQVKGGRRYLFVVGFVDIWIRPYDPSTQSRETHT